jgi:hypothetical protein
MTMVTPAARWLKAGSVGSTVKLLPVSETPAGAVGDAVPPLTE